MNELRRKLLQGSASALLAPLLGTGLLIPGRILAADWNQNAFAARNANDALKAYGAANHLKFGQYTQRGNFCRQEPDAFVCRS